MSTTRTFSVLFILLLFALSGCTGFNLGPDTPPTNAQEQAALQNKADEAWHAGKRERALSLYQLVLQGQALTREAKLLALERSARLALDLDRGPEAKQALETWASVEPKAKSTWEWTELMVAAMDRSGQDRQAEELLAKIIQTRGAAFSFTSQAGIELARRYASRDFASQAAQVLRTLHAKAPNRKARAQYEADTARMFSKLSPKGLTAMLSTVNEANHNVFPYNLAAFEDARRTALYNPGEMGKAQELADRLAKSSDLADRGLPGRILAKGVEAATGAVAEAPPLPEKDVEPVKPGSVSVAMLLPQTGQLRGLAGKVLAGANAAKAQLAAQGIQVDIRVINTDDPNYVDQLVALPHEVMLVGGPMHTSYFKNLPQSGELSRRVFLSFTPEVADAEEGKQIWRFFWSPADEVNAVLNLPIEEGLNKFGVLYPEDRMGKRLADAFTSAVAARGGEVTSIQPYPPQDVPKWGEIVRTMVRATPKGTDGKSFNVRPDFQAVFIPDELQRADHIIGQLQYYQADSLIILGPQLWTEALGGAQKPNISPPNYRYAFCSGAWWAQSPSKAVGELRTQLARDKQGEPDFWSALGFDFIRLAANTGAMPKDPAPSEVTARLNEASKKMEWALAPITWDGSGHARMAMHFLRPSVEGLAAVDREGFKERLDAATNKPAAGAVPPAAPGTIQAAPGQAAPAPGQAPAPMRPAPAPAQ
ncbi:penicillin-binding protein activator [Fundidesulfovibrio agrisoli]|uniref:penicillin-binding protein activator n=1 Tax=Fundidesulfovibrio agrisoli TaxID=2922717 RepID=UPI001FAD39ED|nr:penicillin-binding protein activator [Fundidesulfovibrio agrisoli]